MVGLAVVLEIINLILLIELEDQETHQVHLHLKEMMVVMLLENTLLEAVVELELQEQMVVVVVVVELQVMEEMELQFQ